MIKGHLPTTFKEPQQSDRKSEFRSIEANLSDLNYLKTAYGYHLYLLINKNDLLTDKEIVVSIYE